MLSKIALNDDDKIVRSEAAKKITDENVLLDILSTEKDRFVRQVAVKNLTNPQELIKIALNDEDQFVRNHAISNPALVEESDFTYIAINSEHEDIANEALNHITEEKNYIAILKNAKLPDIRKATLDNITDLETLIRIVLANEDEEFSLKALNKIKVEKCLMKI